MSSVDEEQALPQIGPTLARGLRRKCPHCGLGEILRKGRLRHHCKVCGYIYERRGGDLFFFLYVGAGAITFVFLAFMYLFRVWTYGWPIRVPYLLLGMATMIGLMSRRMGLAVALDYFSRVLFEDRSEWCPSVSERNEDPPDDSSALCGKGTPLKD